MKIHNTYVFDTLVEAMGAISDRCFCANWMNGIEAVVWEAVLRGEDCEIGQGYVTCEELAFVKALSDRCDLWVTWGDTPQVTPVELPLWRLLWAKKHG